MPSAAPQTLRKMSPLSAHIANWSAHSVTTPPAWTVREMLVRIGTDHHSLIAVSRATTTKTRIVARAQQVVRVDEEDDGDVTGAEVALLLAAVERAVAAADAVVLEDYNKGVLVPAVIDAATKAAAARGIPVVVDPKFPEFLPVSWRHRLQAQPA